jgi:hypothetical protein
LEKNAMSSALQSFYVMEAGFASRQGKKIISTRAAFFIENINQLGQARWQRGKQERKFIKNEVYVFSTNR